jgi:uroporphyrinogen decarboxylase
MNSRERVKSVISRRTPDVVPTDMWGSASRVHNDLYAKLLALLDITDPGVVIRPSQTTSYENYTLSDKLGTDFRHINIGKPDGFKSYKDGEGFVYDEWGVGRDYSTDYPTVSYFPLADASESDIDGYKWPVMRDEGRIRGLAEKARDWYENTDKAITATAANSGMFFELGQFLRGHEKFFMDFYIEKKLTHRLISKLTELLIELNLYYLKPIAPYLEWVEFTSDLGTQNGPFMSEEMFRTFFKQSYRDLFSEVKRAYPHLKIFYHTCGAVFNFIPDLIDTGVDILNPIQPLAMGMDPAKIKSEFGDSLAFHGAIDIQYAMRGNIRDVENEVKLRFEQMGGGGGYIISPSNHLLPDVPAENVVEMYRAAKEYGRYDRGGMT